MVDEIDVKILKNILIEARLSYNQIARRVGVSTMTAHSRIKKMEKQKVIKGYAALLDHNKLGYELTAIIEVKTTKGKMVQVEKHLSGNENVCAVYDVTGGSDAIIIAKFKHGQDLSEFVKDISSHSYVQNTITHVVLDTVKEDFRLV